MKKIILNFMHIAFAGTLLLLLSFLNPVHIFAQENSLDLSVSQEIRTNSPYPKPKDSVSYRLDALDKAPLPEGAKDYYDFTIFGENTYNLHFENLSKGTYHYKLYQLTLDDKSLLSKDSRTYFIKVEVFQSTETIVIRPSLEDDNYHKVEHLNFVNEMSLRVEEEITSRTFGGGEISSNNIVEKITDLPKTAVDYVLNSLTLGISTGTLLLFLLIIFKKKEKNKKLEII